MPELPEVETSLRGVGPYLTGQTIKQIITRTSKLRWEIPVKLSQMAGAKILRLSRRAKYLLIHTNQGDLIVHLGMSGSLGILHKGDKVAGKHDHVDLVCENGTVLRYNDPRKFGCWLWAEKAEEHELIKKLGVEPLSDDFTSGHLFEKSRQKTVAVKNFIMNNENVVGVGNIYASESLFIAGIHPELAAQNLTKKQCERLVKTIKAVLTKSIIQGGTTLKDFIQPNGKAGYFAQELQVYGRKGEECYDCGSLIEAKVIGQRNTYFCPKCQKLPR